MILETQRVTLMAIIKLTEDPTTVGLERDLNREWNLDLERDRSREWCLDLEQDLIWQMHPCQGLVECH